MQLSSCGTPSFSELFILDAVLARLQVTLDEACQKGEIDLRSNEGLDIFQALKINPDQVPVSGLLQLIQILAKTTRFEITVDNIFLLVFDTIKIKYIFCMKF